MKEESGEALIGLRIPGVTYQDRVDLYWVINRPAAELTREELLHSRGVLLGTLFRERDDLRMIAVQMGRIAEQLADMASQLETKAIASPQAQAYRRVQRMLEGHLERLPTLTQPMGPAPADGGAAAAEAVLSDLRSRMETRG